ncbi:MAG: hypothetical protein KGM96_08100 [Acidobacteriota bacterium]|nr:hypothetical protein [Acidobacteriota bacterium]
MRITEMIPGARRLGQRLIRWGVRLFILSIGISLLILIAALFGGTFGVGWQLAIQLGIAISMSFGFTPLLLGCTLLIVASVLEDIFDIKDSRNRVN